MEQPQPKKAPIHWFRWYDRYPNIRAIIKLSEDLSPATQHEIGEKFLAITQRIWKYPQHRKWDGGAVPADILESLKKGTLKNRWYDQIVPMYKALNLLMMLPPKSRMLVDKECAFLVGYIGTYKKGINPVRTVTLPILPMRKWVVNK